MRFEEAGRCRVYLFEKSELSQDPRCQSYIQFVQLGLYTIGSSTSIWKQELGDCVDNSRFVGTEINREHGPIHFSRSTVGLVKHVLALVSETRWLTVAHQHLDTITLLLSRKAQRKG